VTAGPCDVLVVDDQAPVREMLRLMLHRFGLGAVALAADGAEAVAALRRAVPRAMISDIDMPTLNGLELLKRVRGGDTAAPRDLPVLMLTGHGETPVVLTALALDVSGFVLKPATPANLKPRLDRVLAGSRVGLKDAASYRAVAISDATLAVVGAPAGSPSALPPARTVPLDRGAVGKILAAPVRSVDGQTLFAAGSAVTASIVDCLTDLADIGAAPRELAVLA
jgi:DNA-binding NarL/FixJ family response regulator